MNTTPRHPGPPIIAPPPDDPDLYGRVLAIELPAGDDGARAMMHAMRAIVHDSDRHQYVARLARKIYSASRAKCGEKSPKRGEARMNPLVRTVATRFKLAPCLVSRLIGVYDLLVQAQKFTRDPAGSDMPRHVDQLVYELEQLGPGQVACDCDDIAMLGASLLRWMGFETAFCAVGDSPADKLRHVFYCVKIRGAWVPFDPQERTPPFVWPARAQRREILPVD